MASRIKWLIVTLCVFCTLPCAARLHGQPLIDSLIKELPNGKEDTNNVKLRNALCYAYVNIDPAHGILYGESALALADKLEWKKGIAAAYGMLGVNYMSRSDYPKALEYALKSLELNEELGDKKAIAGNYGNIANIYNNQENYTSALDYYSRAQKIFEELGAKDGLAITLGNIGNTYNNLNNYAKNLEYSMRALKLCEELNDRHGIASDLGNISSSYASLHNYPKALEYGLRAIKIFEELGDKNDLIANVGNIGACYLAMARDTIVVQTASEKKEKLQKALEYLNRAVALAKEIGDLDYLQTYSLNLSEVQKMTGDYLGALESYQQYVTMHDSVFGSTNKIKIIELERKREQDLKNLELVKKHDERIFFIAGIVLLLLVILVVLRNYNLQKRSNRLLSGEKKRSDDLLLNILPAGVAEELKETGTAAAKYFEHVTVMFTDFVGFTKAGEKMTPQQLVDELHTCFKAFDEIIRKNNIEKIKTVGDAYLAASGLPQPNPKHAIAMLTAAREIAMFMHDRKKKLGDKTFEVRIGVHTGNVVAGIVGVIKFAYDIWGDTVNTAARMEEKSEPGRINISQTTYELVKEEFHCTYRGEIDAKNKGVMKMYFVE